MNPSMKISTGKKDEHQYQHLAHVAEATEQNGELVWLFFF
jgi:hypothetical protein